MKNIPEKDRGKEEKKGVWEYPQKNEQQIEGKERGRGGREVREEKEGGNERKLRERVSRLLALICEGFIRAVYPC